MKRPGKRRVSPNSVRLGSFPANIDLEALLKSVRYVGSVEHKDTQSFAGPPRPRAKDASICDASLHDKQPLVESWLKARIEAGFVSQMWEQGFPRYVWYRDGDDVYQARHTRNGAYKGWPLDKDDPRPKELQ